MGLIDPVSQMFMEHDITSVLKDSANVIRNPRLDSHRGDNICNAGTFAMCEWMLS